MFDVTAHIGALLGQVDVCDLFKVILNDAEERLEISGLGQCSFSYYVPEDCLAKIFGYLHVNKTAIPRELFDAEGNRLMPEAAKCLVKAFFVENTAKHFLEHLELWAWRATMQHRTLGVVTVMLKREGRTFAALAGSIGKQQLLNWPRLES